jgi:protein involved in polysaccharide export with SLBB domain
MKAMSFGTAETGLPLDIAELERRFPELKGIVLTAPQWIEEFDRMKKASDEGGKPLYEYRIPYGAHLTIEVTGEPTLTRSYTVPPTGYVHYPYLNKLKVSGLTMDELKTSMEKDLSVYLRKPEVLVHINTTPYTPETNAPAFLQQTFGSSIIVMGAARTRFFTNVSFTGRETLVNILGSTDMPENVEWRQIRVIRRDDKDPLRKSRVIVCDLWDYFAKADVRQDIPLLPGDVVFVPIRWSVDDQFWDDWTYVRRIIEEVFFLDTVRDGLKKGGTLRH